ncbi:MAG: hypothetical protein GEV08_19595 [Acidimicrobiia bacterium]|nr:hypothetical protein [Acidimicrobiia bacterium]
MLTGLHPNHVVLLSRPEVDDYLHAAFGDDDACWVAFLRCPVLEPDLDLADVADIAAKVVWTASDTRFRFLERAIAELDGPVSPAEGAEIAASALAAADTVLRITTIR